jgi:hypothetical protein
VAPDKKNNMSGSIFALQAGYRKLAFSLFRGGVKGASRLSRATFSVHNLIDSTVEEILINIAPHPLGR